MATKVSKVRYSYRVPTHVFDRVFVEKFRLISTTEKTITFYDENGREQEEGKKGPAHCWFPTFGAASKFALAEIAKRVAHYQTYIKALTDSADEIKDNPEYEDDEE
jgi:hypothetical protein